MSGPHDAPAERVPAVGSDGQLTLVAGRTFALSDRAGNMIGGLHGMVHGDRRHLSTFVLEVASAGLQVLASHSPSPLTAVVVSRLTDPVDDRPTSCVLIRRRQLSGAMREDIEIRQTATGRRFVQLDLAVGADFAHVFEVKEGTRRQPGTISADDLCWQIASPLDGGSATTIRWDRQPTVVDTSSARLSWQFEVPARSSVGLTVVVEPAEQSDPDDDEHRKTERIVEVVPVRAVTGWRDRSPRVVSTDPRLAPVMDQALADLAALRIVDHAHPDRVVTAAGAPWFMTLFGRDSLITALMTLCFDPDLAGGVLRTLADLQGRHADKVSEEQPGRILHELRRRGGGGAFVDRSRYYGTVDATPLFVMLASEAYRWGAVNEDELKLLAPAIDAAIGWIEGYGDSDGDGFVDYEASHPDGLSNQGWKDSWDGVTFADGRRAEPPIALVEVQGYTYAALLGAAYIADVVQLRHDAGRLRRRAEELRDRFNTEFWDDRGWFVLGLDREHRPIDSLTTNPGHALWCGIADDSLADQYLERLVESRMWTGWGLRTLSADMAAFDALSYHNGSVWPHDTAICAAGAARYGRWDVVDLLTDGIFDAALHFGSRPPELFAGISRSEVPVPVAYPASCAPQAWSSAAVLMLLRTVLGLEPEIGPNGLVARRPELATIDGLELLGLYSPPGRVDVRVVENRVAVTPQRPESRRM